MKTISLTRSIVTLIFFILSFSLQAQIKDPASYYGFTPGDDRKLITYEELVSYLKILDAASGKMSIEQIGQSEMGKPMYLVFISSEANIRKLDRLKEINRELALNHNLSPAEQKNLVDEGKVFFLFTLSMHSNEVAPSQSAPLIAHELITSEDPKILNILENTVYMMVPSHNPDGMNMIVEHYKSNLGTKYEGSSMPGVYHKYVGHNINRDFITLLQSENKAIAKVYSTEWYPQVMVEKHQMGSGGPRYFVSPPHDPVSENIQPGIWNWMRIFGSRSLTEMTNAGLKGVSVNYLFDNYWPGATSTSNWKGVISMLSEAASVDIASPIYIEPNELSVSGKGLAEYKISINMPAPWSGGWWHLSDIVEYERVNTISYLNTAALHKDEILRFRNDLTKKEVERGFNEAPFYYVLPLEQHDQSELAALVNLLHQHGVQSFRLTEKKLLNNRLFNEGDIIIPLAQPFRAFIKEVMEAQKFPVRNYTTGGPMIRPYDITTWSLPLHKGVEAVEINQKTEIAASMLTQIEFPFSFVEAQTKPNISAVIFNGNNNESFLAAFKAIKMGMNVFRLKEDLEYNGRKYPAGSFMIDYNKNLDDLTKDLMVPPVILEEKIGVKRVGVKLPRIALIESWFHDMDAGWTRHLFDTYQISYKVLRPSDLQSANLAKDFDLIIFPDQAKSVLFDGRYGQTGNYAPPRYSPEYAKGMEQKGLNNLLGFVQKGGKVISWGTSTELFMGNLSFEDEKGIKEEFRLPVRNIADELSRGGLDMTGSLMRIKLMKNHPLTLGMQDETGIFHRGNPVFATSFPYMDMDRRVIGSFAEENILMSGFSENEKLLAGKPALVWLKKGQGQIILFAFAPQFRGSTPATFKLLFNGILMQKIEVE
jgi:hypothetical protein